MKNEANITKPVGADGFRIFLLVELSKALGTFQYSSFEVFEPSMCPMYVIMMVTCFKITVYMKWI